MAEIIDFNSRADKEDDQCESFEISTAYVCPFCGNDSFRFFDNQEVECANEDCEAVVAFLVFD